MKKWGAGEGYIEVPSPSLVWHFPVQGSTSLLGLHLGQGMDTPPYRVLEGVSLYHTVGILYLRESWDVPSLPGFQAHIPRQYYGGSWSLLTRLGIFPSC